MEEKQNRLLTDKFGRFHNYLRISLTDRCNLRCTYCMPENVMFMPGSHLLTAEEIDKLAEIFINLGVSKIRLTGGEPFARPDFAEILKRLSVHQVELAITTNGFLLDRYLTDLIHAKISSVNISLDTLDEDRFKKITHRNYFNRIINNIQLAADNGLRVKLNSVIIRDFNRDEILDFSELTLKNPIDVRFIEFMPFRDNNWNQNNLVRHKEILHKLQSRFKIEKLPDKRNQTTQYYRIPQAMGRIGIISTVSDPFCNECNRLRLTADGKLKNCLFGTDEYDLKTPLRKGNNISSVIKKAVIQKHEARGGHKQFSNIRIKEYQKNRSMVAIGG